MDIIFYGCSFNTSTRFKQHMDVLVMPITQESTAENRERAELLTSRKKIQPDDALQRGNLQFWSCEFHLMKQRIDQTLHLIQEDKSVSIWI